ncbi:MAG: HEAT repeat domain-containing protein [Alkalibacterium sp.]|nr:HEAT repeat domain-containing protein [Alkalibacterium sp.]
MRAFWLSSSKVHHEQAITILKQLIRDPNWLVRRNAAEALLAHDEKGQNALMDLLESDDPYASDAAEAVLQREALYL